MSDRDGRLNAESALSRRNAVRELFAAHTA